MKSVKAKDKKLMKSIVLELSQARLQGDMYNVAIRVDTDKKEGRKFERGKSDEDFLAPRSS